LKNNISDSRLFGKFDSWKIVDQKVAIKTTDKTLFLENRSRIPIEIRWYFDADKLVPGEEKEILLVYRGKEYSAFISRDRHESQRTNIGWRGDLGKQFTSLYPDFLKYDINTFPSLLFKKSSNRKYEILIVNTQSLGSIIEGDLESIIQIAEVEGKKKLYYTTKYERNPYNKAVAILLHGTTCMVCGFNFEKVYGEVGLNYIEVHHIIPLSSRDEEISINPKTDFVCACSNCHRMIHRKKGQVLTINELMGIVICQMSQKIF
jgi:5-methylcytosine-specific restriction protein A